MKKPENTSAKFYDPSLLRSLVERLASDRKDKGYYRTQVPEQWAPLETACTQAYVMGQIEIPSSKYGYKKPISVPFTSHFLFTCIKEKYGLFNLEWSFSMC